MWFVINFMFHHTSKGRAFTIKSHVPDNNTKDDIEQLSIESCFVTKYCGFNW